MTVALLYLASALTSAPQTPVSDPTLHFGHFGTVSMYRPTAAPTSVVLFFSGDGGWNQGVVDMARAAAASGTLVLGVDTPRYLKSMDARGDRCSYFAADAEALSQFAQKSLGLAHYLPPVLVGYSSGAGLVYATLAQAPENTFQGALSIAFDPLLPTQTSPCDRNGLRSTVGPNGHGRRVGAVERLPAPWLILQGDEDVVSPIDSVAAFARDIPGSEIVRLPHVGHGFSKPMAWMPQFKSALTRLAATPASDATSRPAPLGGLPVVELAAPANPTDFFAIVLSGDGGWASIDKQIGEELVKSGVPTVGFNSLQYFWQKRSPQETSLDLARMSRHYQAAFHRERVILIGYSLGADVLPLMTSRLPVELLDQVRLIAFLGLGHQTDLEFRMGDWLAAQHPAAFKLLPEMQKLQGRPMLCVYGTKEDDSLCPDLPVGLAEIIELKGGHHFDGDFHGLARLILAHVKPDARNS
jgi:type IV secretory pathway VirJ component